MPGSASDGPGSAGQFSRWGPSDRHRPRSGRNSHRYSPHGTAGNEDGAAPPTPGERRPQGRHGGPPALPSRRPLTIPGAVPLRHPPIGTPRPPGSERQRPRRENWPAFPGLRAVWAGAVRGFAALSDRDAGWRQRSGSPAGGPLSRTICAGEGPPFRCRAPSRRSAQPGTGTRRFSFPSIEFPPVKTAVSGGPHTPSPRYNPSRSPGRGSVWQSTWFGIRGSQVQILPPRRGPPDAARPDAARPTRRPAPTRPARRGPPRRGPPDAARPPDRQVPADGFRQTGSRPEAATAPGCFGRIFPRPFPPGNCAVISALTHGSKRVYFGAPAGDGSSRWVPFFLLLLLDIPKSGVMELVRMFAPSAPAHFSVTVRSEPHTAGFLPLGPVAHILAARLAGAGTRRFALSYQRWE